MSDFQLTDIFADTKKFILDMQAQAALTAKEDAAARAKREAQDSAFNRRASKQLAANDRATNALDSDLASLMKQTFNSPDMLKLASHPDFPALAQDGGVQQLVSSLTNQVGSVLSGLNQN